MHHFISPSLNVSGWLSRLHSKVLSLQAKDFLLASSIQDGWAPSDRGGGGCCWEMSGGDVAGSSDVTVSAIAEKHKRTHQCLYQMTKLWWTAKNCKHFKGDSQSSALLSVLGVMDFAFPSILLEDAALFIVSSSAVQFLPLSCQE